jgi:hypothetical protein
MHVMLARQLADARGGRAGNVVHQLVDLRDWNVRRESSGDRLRKDDQVSMMLGHRALQPGSGFGDVALHVVGPHGDLDAGGDEAFHSIPPSTGSSSGSVPAHW